MSQTPDVLQLDGLAQAEQIRSGAIGAIELVDTAIARIEALNPVLNSVVIERFERARAEARRVRAGDRAAFTGVPVLLKDLGQEIRGMRQTDGSRAVVMQRARHDSHLAASYRRAGMIFLGKTSSPEFGNHSTTEPVAHGPCRNPWDTARTAGGSSGGSAAAVAARLVAVAGASDGAGSIRIPASCCGVFGLKPTRGRIANTADTLLGLSTNHSITRSVRDSAALLDVSSGPVQGAPYSLVPPPRPFLAEAGAEPDELRIATSVIHPTGARVHPDCVSATDAAAALLTGLGHRVEEASPDFDVTAMTHSMLDIWATANASAHDGLTTALGRAIEPHELESTTWELIEHARGLSADQLARSRDHVQAAGSQIARFFERYDLWLTPTLAQPPLPLGELNQSLGSAAAWWEYDLEFNPWNPVANISGSPAASLPLHWNERDLPIGSMLTAGFGEEAKLIRVCSQLERAKPWADRAPSVKMQDPRPDKPAVITRA